MSPYMRGAYALIALLLLPSLADAQTLPNGEVRGLYMQATKGVFQGTAEVFSCLSSARNGQAQQAGSFLVTARQTLRNAQVIYNRIAEDRQKTRMSRDVDSVSAATISAYNLDQRNAGKKAIEFEGDVATANVEAIGELLKQLESWQNCSPRVPEFLKFIENKIKLERASQLSEIAFSAIPPK